MLIGTWPYGASVGYTIYTYGGIESQNIELAFPFRHRSSEVLDDMILQYIRYCTAYSAQAQAIMLFHIKLV